MAYKIDKKELIVLTLIIVAAAVLGRMVNLWHWTFETALVVSSYSPYHAFVGVAGIWASLIVLFKKIERHLWPVIVSFIIGGVYVAVLMYATIVVTYPEMFVLKPLLLAEIVGLSVLTWWVVND